MYGRSGYDEDYGDVGGMDSWRGYGQESYAD
jgi:hypothetical protein